jgi:hypothetical protein
VSKSGQVASFVRATGSERATGEGNSDRIARKIKRTVKRKDGEYWRI